MKLFQHTPLPHGAGYRRSPTVTIRWATPDDAGRLETLAELDETVVPPAPLLLAFAGDELWDCPCATRGLASSSKVRPRSGSGMRGQACIEPRAAINVQRRLGHLNPSCPDPLRT
jgi:hypothetical protein